jgi:hypothetical protein
MHETWSWHAYRYALDFLRKIGCDKEACELIKFIKGAIVSLCTLPHMLDFSVFHHTFGHVSILMTEQITCWLLLYHAKFVHMELMQTNQSVLTALRKPINFFFQNENQSSSSVQNSHFLKVNEWLSRPTALKKREGYMCSGWKKSRPNAKHGCLSWLAVYPCWLYRPMASTVYKKTFTTWFPRLDSILVRLQSYLQVTESNLIKLSTHVGV